MRMHDAVALSKNGLNVSLPWTCDLPLALMFARMRHNKNVNPTYIYRLYNDGDLHYRDNNSGTCVRL